MNEAYNEDQSRLEFSKESASLLLRQKLLFSSNDHFSVLLLGSENSDDYDKQNIQYIKSMDVPELETFDVIRNIKSNENGNKGDCKY